MWYVTHFLTSRGKVVPIYGTTYSTTKSVVNKNSIYETKTISGDLISEKKTNDNKKRFDVKDLARRRHVHISTKRTVLATQGVYAKQITSRNRFLAFKAIRCRYCDCCPHANVISYCARPKGEKKAKYGENKKNDSQVQFNNGVEKASRENKRLRSEAQLSLRSTSSVEWPRCIERGRKNRCWLGGQLLFFLGVFSCHIKPHMWERNRG